MNDYGWYALVSVSLYSTEKGHNVSDIKRLQSALPTDAKGLPISAKRNCTERWLYALSCPMYRRLIADS